MVLFGPRCAFHYAAGLRWVSICKLIGLPVAPSSVTLCGPVCELRRLVGDLSNVLPAQGGSVCEWLSRQGVAEGNRMPPTTIYVYGSSLEGISTLQRVPLGACTARVLRCVKPSSVFTKPIRRGASVCISRSLLPACNSRTGDDSMIGADV